MRKKCSKRSFAGQIRAWRRRLHEWDLPNSEVDDSPMVAGKVQDSPNTCEKVSEQVNNTGFRDSKMAFERKRSGQHQEVSPRELGKKMRVTSHWTDVTCNPSAVNPLDIPEDLLISYSDDEL